MINDNFRSEPNLRNYAGKFACKHLPANPDNPRDNLLKVLMQSCQSPYLYNLLMIVSIPCNCYY